MCSTSMRFYGKTESHYKYKTPKLRMKTVRPIYPAPGLSLKPPADLTPIDFCRQIGGDTEEYAEKFETTQEIFDFDGQKMKSMDIPVH